jgi:hypothetical protein
MSFEISDESRIEMIRREVWLGFGRGYGYLKNCGTAGISFWEPEMIGRREHPPRRVHWHFRPCATLPKAILQFQPRDALVDSASTFSNLSELFIFSCSLARMREKEFRPRPCLQLLHKSVVSVASRYWILKIDLWEEWLTTNYKKKQINKGPKKPFYDDVLSRTVTPLRLPWIRVSEDYKDYAGRLREEIHWRTL